MSAKTTMDSPSGDIAIVGMSCRFPGEGTGVDKFWQSISSGQSAWSQIPADRFNANAFWDPTNRTNSTITRHGFFLKEDISKFDAGFFTLPKAEAHAMDPQQRMLVETSYEAFESAGLSLKSLAGSKTGVYVGVFTHDYYEMLRKDPENMPSFAMQGTASTAMAGRLSWLWDLRGPSFALDTACSSSLVALHLAVQGLRSGECDNALVGGSNLLLTPEMYKVASRATFLSPDGRSKAFDASADGYGRGEGAGALVLKRVEDAIRDGDPIRAVVRSTACNQDGHTMGMTLPSGEAQATLIRDAYRTAGLDMHDTGYVEAHGTGTQAGDREETQSLSSTIASAKKEASDEELLIGSVKSNIGHLEACAGIAAMIKTVLVLEHGFIPPTISANMLNPKIPFDKWNLSVPTALTPFPGSGLRRAGVNSFGFCGTNAHVVVDDAYSYLQSRQIDHGNHFTRQGSRARSGSIAGLPIARSRHGSIAGLVGHASPSEDQHLVFALSAQDKAGIKRVREGLAAYLAGVSDADKSSPEYLTDLAHTLNVRRSHHSWRTYAVSSSVQQLADALNDAEAPSPAYLAPSKMPRLGFVFTGQGAQWAGMGMELMAYPTFRTSILAADRYLRAELGCPWSAEEELGRPKGQSKLGIAEYSQPLCTVLQVALVDLLKDWNIAPNAVTGHSSGEIGAAYCIGAFSREDAWKIAYYRGVLSMGLKDLQGGMMAVGMSHQKASELIEQTAAGEVVVACINSPSSVTLSGDSAGLDKVLAALSKDGIFARKLQVDTAYHSHHMQTVASEYMEAILDMDLQTGPGNVGCVMQSSATGTTVAASELGPAHWVRNLTSPVQFAAAAQDLVRPADGHARTMEKAVDILIEIGPHSALQGPTLQSLKAINVTDVPYTTALSRWEHGTKTCLALAGDLHARSYPVNLSKCNESSSSSPSPRALVGLPRYPWNHQQRYWAETRWARELRLRQTPPGSLLGAPMPMTVAGEHTWRGYMRLGEQPWLADHVVQGSILYPGAGFLATAIQAASQIADPDRQVQGFSLRNIQFILPMVLQEDRDVEFTVVLRPHLKGTMSTENTWTEFVISSSSDGEVLERNCIGLIKLEYADSRDLLDATSVRQHIHDTSIGCKMPIVRDVFYQHLAELGLGYGPSFATASSIRVRPGQSTAFIDVPHCGLDGVRGAARPHVIHPAALDAIFHTMFAAIMATGDLTTPAIPKSMESIFVSMDAPFAAREQFGGVCTARPQGLSEYLADIYMEDHKTKKPVVRVIGLCAAKVAGDEHEVDTSATRTLACRPTWKPHAGLLDERELETTIREDSDSALHALSGLIGLLHHVNPSMTIVELSSSDQILLLALDLDASILSTAVCQIVYRSEIEQSVADQISHAAQPINAKVHDQAAFFADSTTEPSLLIATDDGSESFSDLAQAMSVKVSPKGGRFCIVHQPTATPETKAPGFQVLTTFKDSHRAVTVFTKDSEVSLTNGKIPEEVVLLSNGKHALERALSDELQRRGFNPVVVPWDNPDVAAAVGPRRCISLLESDVSLLNNITSHDYNKLVSIIRHAVHVTWLIGDEEADPSFQMTKGMFRVLHNEMPGLDPVCVSMNTKSQDQPEQLSSLVVRIFASAMADRDFRIVDGVPQVCRFEPDVNTNEAVGRDLTPQSSREPELMSLADTIKTGHPLKLSIGKPGQLDSIRFRLEEALSTPLLETEIEIDVKASALNFRDVMSIMALLPNPTLGIEASGIIRQVGSAVSHFQVGDRVALIGEDAHASIMRGKACNAFKLPEHMSFSEAAALPIVSYTAWYGIVKISNAKKGQTILIHAGTGGVGQTAIQLAQILGLEIFTTVGTEEKRHFLREKFGIADDHIFGSRDLGFATGVMTMTDGRGVDIIINSLAGEALRRSWECIAPSGHFIEIGLKDIVDDTRLGMRPFKRGASFTSVNILELWPEDQIKLMAEIVDGTAPYLTSGQMKPADPLVAYPVSDMVKALRLLQGGKHKGKLVIDWTSDVQVPVVRHLNHQVTLGEGVILLVGGMGGLGRSLTRMLVSQGARQLCFLSRSAGTSIEARLLLEELEEQGVQARTIACNISEPSSLVDALAECKAKMGKIQGAFHCGAALRDNLFVNMPYEDWLDAVRVKVQGSQNLSDALPDVDFFIMLSSFANIFGNRGQVNYAAGCAFQDGLAQQRRALGRAAISVDLGMMRDVGGLAENGAMGDIAAWERVIGIREDQFLALMRVCLQKDTAAQITTGIGTRARFHAAGIPPAYYFESDPRFGILAHLGGSQGAIGGEASYEGQPLSNTLPQATSLQEAGSMVQTALAARVGKMLDVPPSDLDSSRFLHSYGVDSLGAIEVVNWALRDVQARIAVFDVLAAVSMAVFCERVAARSTLLPKQLLVAE